MRKHRLCLLAACLFICQWSYGQSAPAFQWWNPAHSDFPVVEGQAWPKEVARPYDRLPARAEKTVRKAVWDLSRDAAGLVIRFRTNAPQIRVRYTVSGGLSMPHMPSTGVSGVDLYAVDKNGAWEWSGGAYHFGDTITYDYKSLPEDYTREYHLYLPLYNQVTWLEIGVPAGAKFQPMEVPADKPIVIYGTSIAQGGCASRPGMAWTAILGRRLHDPVINLAFSGNGRLEDAITGLLTELDAKVFVLDCLPNLGGFPTDTVAHRLERTVKTLRNRRPTTPIVVVEHADAAIHSLNQDRNRIFTRVNQVADSVFAIMKTAGINDLYLLPADEIGLNNQSTVDGVHPGDYGMMQYALGYEKALRLILHEPVGSSSTMQPCRQYRDQTYDWYTRHRKILTMARHDSPEVVLVGNSITHYWGGDPQAPIRRGEDSWEQSFAAYRTANLGYGWDRVENVLWRIYHGELDGYQARQILLMIGTNNLGLDSDQEIVDGIGLLLQQIRLRQPQAEILLQGIYPRRGKEAWVEQMNGRLARLAGDANVTFVDPGAGLLTNEGKINDQFFEKDGLHPNGNGYRILAKQLQPYLPTHR